MVYPLIKPVQVSFLQQFWFYKFHWNCLLAHEGIRCLCSIMLPWADLKVRQDYRRSVRVVVLIPYLVKHTILCLRNRTTPTFRFSSLVYGLCANLCFSSTRVDWWLINKNVIFRHFSLSPLHFCQPIGFVFIRMRNWESRNSRILCIKKSRFAHRP